MIDNLKIKKSIFNTDHPEVVKLKIKNFSSHAVLAILRFVLLFGISFVILYPILSIICGSFMSLDDVVDITVKYFPKHFTMSNYKDAWKALNYMSTLTTSVLVFGIVSLAQMFACTMVGYGLARFKFKFNGLIFACVIIQLLIPPDTIMLTRYIEFRYFDFFGIIKVIFGQSANLTTSALPVLILGMTCMGLKNGLFIFILRQYFRGLPRSLEEAAYVDGCGTFKTFIKFMLPGALPMMVTVFLFSFVWMWTDTTVAPTLTTSNILVNMTYMLTSTADSTGGLQLSLLKNAGIILILLPVIIVYIICQKFFVQGIESSGLTGT